MSHQRWNIHFSGRVQGVGFRYQTLSVAQCFPITGWVANLKNGSVQVVVEGEADEIQNFVDRVQETMHGFIRQTEIEKVDTLGAFSQFEIRY